MGFSRQEYWSGLPFPSPIKWIRRVKKRLEVIMGERLYLHDHEVLFLFFSKFSNVTLIFYNGKKKCASGLVTLLKDKN